MKGKARKHHQSILDIKRLRLHHKILFTIIGVVGVILIWRGVWEIVDGVAIINNPYLSFVVGLVLVVASGIFFRLI